MNGIFYPADEIGRYIDVWNGKLISIGHPKNGDGKHVSVNSPNIAAQTIGTYYNAQMDGKKLKGEWWLDIGKIETMGGKALEVLQRAEAGEVLEESTGLFFDVEQTAGVHEGKRYTGIARNLRPDHLAILLDETGACSIRDGCGGPRVNSMIVNVELSLDERQQRVYEAWYQQHGDMEGYIRDVFNDFIVVRQGTDMFSYPYTIDEEDAISFGEPVQIEMVYQEKQTGIQLNSIVDRIVAMLGINKKEQAMKDQLISNLVANSRCKFNADQLGKWEESELLTLAEMVANSAPEPQPAPAVPVTPEPASAPALPAEITAFAQMIQNLGGIEALQTALSSIKTNSDNERQQVISQVVANTGLAEADLTGLGVEQLRKLADISPAGNYAGRGMFLNSAGQMSDWEPYKRTNGGKS